MISRIQASISYQIVFVFAFSILIICSAVIWNINDIGYQTRSFEHYKISKTTYLDLNELETISKGIRYYFNSTQSSLEVSFPNSPDTSVFNDKEISHMKDVKTIIHYIYVLFALTLGIVIATIFGYIQNSYAKKRFFQLMIISSIITLVTTILIGVLMLFAFEQMFLLFHLISFNNDDWILNPSTDYLLMMYPLPFWFSVSARVGIMIIIISIISLIISVYSNRKLA